MLEALIGGVVLLAVLVVGLVVSRYRVGGPNEAFIITGSAAKAAIEDLSGQRIVLGGGVFVLPFVQRLQTLDLSSRRIPIAIRGAVSAQGIKCDLEGVAIVKVGGTDGMIRAAAQRFIDQQQGIEVFTQEVLAGSLRAIVGRLTVEEIIKDRAAFASAVAEEAESSLTNQGLAIDTFELQDIQAEGSYIADLGRPEAARVEKEAAIAEAKARQAAEEEQLLAEEAIAIGRRQLELKKAEILSETDAASARAAAAGPLAQAARDQEVLSEREKVAVKNAALKDRELDTQVRKPADAERYRVEQEAQASRNAAIFHAEADKAASIAEAEADAERARLSGESEKSRRSALAEAEAIEGERRGAAERSRREAIAQAVQREGEAEAAAILAKGEAEAEAREKNAEAFKHYGEAAILELLVNVMPEVVRAASEPIGGIERLTVISTDGASQLTKSVAANVEQGMQIGSDLTGLDLRSLFARLAGERGLADGSGRGSGGASSAGTAASDTSAPGDAGARSGASAGS